MISLEWWELILGIVIGEAISGAIHAEERGHQLGEWLAKKAGVHSDGLEEA